MNSGPLQLIFGGYKMDILVTLELERISGRKIILLAFKWTPGGG
jgi:hypothetical protein